MRRWGSDTVVAGGVTRHSGADFGSVPPAMSLRLVRGRDSFGPHTGNHRYLRRLFQRRPGRAAAFRSGRNRRDFSVMQRPLRSTTMLVNGLAHSPSDGS